MNNQEKAGLIKAGKNEEGEDEFIGTDKQWEEAETLCGKPHDDGDNSPEVCAECLAIKLNV